MPDVIHIAGDWFREADRTVENNLPDLQGFERLKILALMACVLGLDSADKATIGAVGVQLKHAFHIGNFEIGLIAAASTAVGAFATLPVGILTDRIHRTRLLTVSILLWSGAMIWCGATDSYLMLLVARVALGAVVATAGPVIFSLTGDFFTPEQRGRIWGYILCGELLGAGFGILISGELAAFLSWRAAFWSLAAASLVLAFAVWRYLPEPPRGGRSHASQKKDDPTSISRKIEQSDIQPYSSQVLSENPRSMSFFRAVRYVLSIRTNVLLLLASAFGYFFFTGLRTFSTILVRERFHVAQETAMWLLFIIGVGAIVGVLSTGRLADRWIMRGRLDARIIVSSLAFFLTAVLFMAGLYMTSLVIAAPLFFFGAAMLGGTNPPLAAARLDVMHPRLWGRAESVRSTVRYLFEAAAPMAFGWVSTVLGSKGTAFSHVTAHTSARPLDHTFMIMLVTLLIAGIILLLARRFYQRDTATAIASEKQTAR